MSIYTNNRILNITELNKQLTILNQNIQSSLDCIKKAQEDYIHLHNQSFHIIDNIITFKTYDERHISFLSPYLVLNIKNIEIKISIDEYFTDLSNKKISIDILFEFSNMISFIQKYCNLTEFFNEIKLANNLYVKINKISKEIKNKLSDLNVPANFLIKHFIDLKLELNNHNTSDETIYLKFTKKIKDKVLLMELSNDEEESNIKLYLPNIDKLLDLNNLSFLKGKYYIYMTEYNEKLFNIYIKELFLLNKTLFDFLLIKDENIKVWLKSDKNKNVAFEFRNITLDFKHINLINEKIKLNHNLQNF